MSGTTKNSSQIYAAATPGYTAGSRIVSSQYVAPTKGNSTPQEYAIIFDEVAHGAAANTYSAIGSNNLGELILKAQTTQFIVKPNGDLCQPNSFALCSNGGEVSIESEADEYKFESVATSGNAGIEVNGNMWVGGLLPPSGASVTNPLSSNAVNISSTVVDGATWVRAGNVTYFQFCNTISVSGVGAFSYEMEFDELNTLRTTNFTTTVQACGIGSASDQGIQVHVSSVIGSKRVLISTVVSATGATSPQLKFGFQVIEG